MKAHFLFILALFGLTIQAAALPPRDATPFNDVSPETARAYVTSRSADITKRTVGGVGIIS